MTRSQGMNSKISHVNFCHAYLVTHAITILAAKVVSTQSERQACNYLTSASKLIKATAPGCTVKCPTGRSLYCD